MNTYPASADIPEWRPLVETQSRTRYDSVSDYLQSNQTIAYVFLSIILVHFFLNISGHLLPSLPRVLWNISVYLTPSRIVFALDPKRETTQENHTEGQTPPMDTFQAKSKAMQRILGLEDRNNTNSSSPSFSSLLSPARTFSGIVGNALLRGGSRENLPPGLGNWDNSCYQNSIIQGLASLRSLAAYLERNINALTERGSFSTHQALKDIIERLNSPACYDQKLWIPAELKSMSSWQQQDAQEYFSKIIEQVDREILQAARGRTGNLGLKAAGPEEHVIGTVSNLKLTDETRSRIVENSSLRNPLEGLLAQRVGCMRCGWTEGLSLIPFNCLTVPLVGNIACSIRDCLDQYMDLESIEGVECTKCTLLRAREQLRNLLEQIKEDKDLSNSPQLPDAPNTLRASFEGRLKAVEEALEEEDFADKTLSNKCHIPSKNRVSTTKSRQAVIARAPQCLAIHINRSLFDENTGMLRKNYAELRFPTTIDLSAWCLGTKCKAAADGSTEEWDTNPRASMLPHASATADAGSRQYELRALITHYGRHENGHYICYRKYPSDIFPAEVSEAVLAADGEKERSERWFRLSDDDVHMVSEQHVLSQGGAFMLLYEAVEHPPLPAKPMDMNSPRLVDVERRNLASNSSFTTTDDMSMASTDALTLDDTDLDTSRTPSISPPAPDRVIPSIEDIQHGTFPKLGARYVVNGSRSSDKDADGISSSPSIVTV
ncbi:hypothetical protein MPDQ_008065 [Monascus purpureus]|uniref:ubiquitinyl hydrolase 1 n=1 Tax=Monascus purpureus TaxID=5098 RepID=A0A507QU68_MONPU|nr:hypothetical protein MPDQ_008065 [Monascus purpureus]BDD54880.1 hypothetical protein MAP00_000454 [Monascus purpureus]